MLLLLLLMIIMMLVVFIMMLLMVLLLLSLLLLMLLLFVADVVVDVVPAVVVVVIVFLLQMYSDKGIPLGEKIVHVRPPHPTPAFCFYDTLPHGQPHAVSGRFNSIFGRWMLLFKELIIDRDSPHIAMKHMSTF